jgi:hypothetical protein
LCSERHGSAVRLRINTTSFSLSNSLSTLLFSNPKTYRDKAYESCALFKNDKTDVPCLSAVFYTPPYSSLPKDAVDTFDEACALFENRHTTLDVRLLSSLHSSKTPKKCMTSLDVQNSSNSIPWSCALQQNTHKNCRLRRHERIPESRQND